MPLTDKGQEILANMKEQYGDKKGEQVFYASRNKGTITGVDSDDAPRRSLLFKADLLLDKLQQLVNRTRADAGKLTKAAVDYSPGKGSDRCRNCVHFDKGTCEVVVGDIDPDYWCKLFRIKP